jgi:hypothetical protein
MSARVVAMTGAAALVCVAGCGSGSGSSRHAAAPGGRSAAIIKVREVAYSFFRPTKVGDGGRACVELTAEEHVRLDRAGGCAKVLSRYGHRFLPGQELVVTHIAVDPKRGTATASVARSAVAGEPPVIRLLYVDGVWRVADTRAARG